MTIIIYNKNKKRELFPKILLPQPKCILPFINRLKYIQNVLKNHLH